MSTPKLNKNTAKLKEQLEEANEKYKGSDDIFGMTLLTNPGYISSARSIMFTSHLKQFLNLNKPEFPRVYTGYEHMVGRNSTGIKIAKSDFKIVAKIKKFDNHLYTLVTYDEANDTYNIFDKKIVEDLTEKFGYAYNNENLDKLEVGDVVKKGDTLYKTLSYDENNNYGFGVNGTFMYLLDNDTIEDAVKCSESFAKRLLSKEVESVMVSINDNDILCNIYGDNDNYKCFPDIGEHTKNKIVCCKRRIYNDQVLYDLKKPNLRKINYGDGGDEPKFCDGKVVDIKIYCNKEIDELPNTAFYEQIKKYLSNEIRYYKEIFEVTKELIESGSKCSRDVHYYYKKSKEILDENYKWREEDSSVFSNIKIEFLIERDVPIRVGSKMSGRYGNKGVVSIIVPDEEMPILENGKRVDVIFNSLGVVNRLNSFQLIEQSINFICNRVVEKLKETKTLQEKEMIFFRVLGYFNQKQSTNLYNDTYRKLDAEGKEWFFDHVCECGMYVNIPPLWEDRPIFDRLRDLYKEFTWIQPYKVYVQMAGRIAPMMRKQIVSEMYIMKLKQTSKKGFSARSTSSISKKGVPEKSDNAKKNKELYSKTPVKIGIDENLNLLIGTDSEELAKLHMFYRSSVVGRKMLGKQLMSSVEPIEDFELTPDIKNRNVEILEAYFKTMGLRLAYGVEKMEINVYTDQISDKFYGDKYVIGDDLDHLSASLDYEAKKNVDENVFVGTPEEYRKEIEKERDNLKARYGSRFIDISID